MTAFDVEVVLNVSADKVRVGPASTLFMWNFFPFPIFSGRVCQNRQQATIQSFISSIRLSVGVLKLRDSRLGRHSRYPISIRQSSVFLGWGYQFICSSKVWVGLALTRESLHRRHIKHFGPTTLRSTIAMNLLKFSG